MQAQILRRWMFATIASAALLAFGCSDDDGGSSANAKVIIKNDFNNPDSERKPPWTVCESSFRDVAFGRIDLGASSEEKEVTPGEGLVYMVAAWKDPSCAPENCLPLATKNLEEVVSGQTRTITLSVNNHQGPCPPEGVQPIPEEIYNKILELWPTYAFKPYAERLKNPKCVK